MSTKQSPDSIVYQLKLSLLGAKPPIWRRIQVLGDTDLATFHRIILDAMGWIGGHLHAFAIDGREYGAMDRNLSDLDYEDEDGIKLADLNLAEKSKFRYTYDFGDDWCHEILVEKILPRKESQSYPFCLKAKRACPPEDCGGIWGYEELLEIVKDPEHPEYEERMEWLNENFDPEAVDLEGINQSLLEYGD